MLNNFLHTGQTNSQLFSLHFGRKLILVASIIFITATVFFLLKSSLSQMSSDFSIENTSPSITDQQPVTLLLQVPWAKEMRFGNTEYELAHSTWESYAETKQWELKTGPEIKIVFAEFRRGKKVEKLQREFDPKNFATSFDTESSNWVSYDYKEEIPQNIFFPVTQENSSGVNNTGYIWTDSSRWGEDTPENPHSILALLTYRQWAEAGKIDLRGATVSVYLRGDGLDLKGGKVYFWVMVNSTRWHFVSMPIQVSEGEWGEKVVFTLPDNESQWSNSWQGGKTQSSLSEVLSSGLSYGFSIVGFPYGNEPIGRLSMDELTITLP